MEHRSFEQIYLQYYKPVYAYLMTLCQNEELAAELTQETFYQAVRSIHRFDGSCQVSTWLCQIAKHLCYQQLRKTRREEPLPEEETP